MARTYVVGCLVVWGDRVMYLAPSTVAPGRAMRHQSCLGRSSERMY